jgi:PAS domain S-box-containing protein
VANKAACVLLGYTEAQLLRSEWSKLFPDQSMRISDIIKQAEGDITSRRLFDVAQKNGKTIKCSISSSLLNAGGETGSVVTTITDMSRYIINRKISENKKLLLDEHNLLLAGSKQKNIDLKNQKIVAHNISLAKKRQLQIDVKNDSIQKMNIAEARRDARDLERSNIAKELHDNINQLLGASKMYLEMGLMGGENSRAYLGRSSEYTLQAINEIRSLTKGLITDIIKNLGLRDAIENIMHDSFEVSGVVVSLDLSGINEQLLKEDFKLNIFRIIQEQLNNILKHAKAKKADIKIKQDGKSISLSISDDGIGFDPKQRREGIGLNNIKERAANFSAAARFYSEPGHGCVLAITFPCCAYKM